MNWRYIMAVSVFGIAACAASGPELPDSGAASPDTVADTAPASAATVDELEFADAPNAPETVVIREPDEVICRMERRTGSHRAQRICRSRADIDREAEQGRDRFDDLLRSQEVSQ